MGFFDDAEEVPSFELVPTGDYVCLLDNMTLDLEGKFGDVFQLELIVAHDDFKNRKVWQTWYLSGDYAGQSKGYLKKTMGDLGLPTEIKELKDVLSAFDTLRGKKLNTYIKQKEKKDGTLKNAAYVNSVFAGSVNDDDLLNHAPMKGVDSTEEIPF